MVCRRLLLAGIIAVAALRAPAVEAEIRIAVAGPMSGAESWFGEQFLHAADLAVAGLNATGGVLGQSIKLGPVSA